MVIITTLIAKVYFPDSLTRGTIPNVRRTYSYRRKAEHREEETFADVEEDELEVLYSDDEEDEHNSHESSDDQEDPLLADMTGHPEPASQRHPPSASCHSRTHACSASR